MFGDGGEDLALVVVALARDDGASKTRLEPFDGDTFADGIASASFVSVESVEPTHPAVTSARANSATAAPSRAGSLIASYESGSEPTMSSTCRLPLEPYT
jgi:hypothetical protein